VSPWSDAEIVKKRVLEQQKRHRIIRDIVNKRGFSGIKEIQTILLDEFGIKTNRTTLYKDMRVLEAIDNTQWEGFSTRIIAEFRKQLLRFDVMANDDSLSPSMQLRAMDLHLRHLASMHKIISLCASKTASAPVPVSSKEKLEAGKAFNIRFSAEKTGVDEKEVVPVEDA